MGEANRVPSKEEEQERNLWVTFVSVIVFVIFMWVVTYFSLRMHDDRGVFGDMFGGLNALFSGLAFAGVIFTILLQRSELSLQREELKETREVFKEQSLTMSRQRFENSFFQMIELKNTTVSNLKVSTTTGIEVINWFNNHLHTKYLQKSMLSGNIDISQGIVTATFIEDVYRDYQDNIWHYFNLIKIIIRLVEDSPLILDAERSSYMGVLKSQLTNGELRLILNYCLSPRYGYPDLLRIGLIHDLFDDMDLGNFSALPGFPDLVEGLKTSAAIIKD